MKCEQCQSAMQRSKRRTTIVTEKGKTIMWECVKCGWEGRVFHPGAKPRVESAQYRADMKDAGRGHQIW